MTALQEEIRAAIRAELQAFREELLREVRPGASDQLASLPKAAAACGINRDTLRRRYLSKLTVYGVGHRARVSVAELRRVMAEERAADAASDLSSDELVARIEAKRRKRRG